MINRFVPTVKLDFKMQVRYGFVYVAALSVIIFVLMLSQLDTHGSLLFLPVFLLTNLLLSTFYFIAGMVLFEKGEGVLQGLIVTPLKIEEYLGSKVFTLTALAIAENIAMVTLVFGTGFNVLLLVLGTIITAMIYILLGFMVVSKYSSISEYLMPSVVYSFAFMIPLLDYLKVLESPLFYLHPMQAPLILMKAAFVPVETWQLAYGVLYSLVWIVVAFVLSKRAFNKHIVNRIGGN
ncbi:ABC transporter [Methanocella sp. CWC-04]|uniref:ABC transporter n=1 Tax=Methanooceanicella nereidis TaxID=2052831 RepID=A0AAP2RAQ3_9EURY|nr:ABC transporter permease [Methanocella sp. CWC-04]MCD1293883.1 ABC transporter [Methanocella sp. CWC-04]